MVAQLTLLMHTFFRKCVFAQWRGLQLQQFAKVPRYCTVFWHKWPFHDFVVVIPPPPLIKVASNTRPCSKLGGTTLNGREEGGQYYISQTCDQQRFEGRKVVFSRECLNTFATGFSLFFQRTKHSFIRKNLPTELVWDTKIAPFWQCCVNPEFL